MVSQVVVAGTLAHRRMTSVKLMDSVRVLFPALVLGGTGGNSNPQPDFSIKLKDCIAEFFCLSTRNLDFVISVVEESTQQGKQQQRAVAATDTLVRTCDLMLTDMAIALKNPYTRRRPRLKQCEVQDPFSNSAILVRGVASPLKSVGAKISFGLAIFWLVTAGALTLWQVHTHQSSDSRRANILAIALALGVAAASTPVPIVINWREWKHSPAWRYKGSDQ